MEKIDQLNTLLLQEIDENFAKFHQVVTSQVLPEVKRFALASEPTREAATVSFLLYELKACDKLQACS
jgi:DASH complex subunit ASK1